MINGRYLRLMFEPTPSVVINNKETFRHLADNYLSDFDNVRFGGYISMDATKKYIFKLEPVWQYIIGVADDNKKDAIVSYICRNPLAGYYVYINEHNPEKNPIETQIFCT